MGDLILEDGVERLGPGKAPTAFRIWRAGVNQTDIGPVNLTARSLAGLLAAQDIRGVRYAFDLNHASLNGNAPSANQVAIGDHRIDGRNGELWAVDCQFSDWARAQIEAKPVPGLRYYSPAYDVDKDTREPTRYVNSALTPNPATWNATALAAAKGTSMDPQVDASAIFGALHKLAMEAKDPADRARYMKALSVLMPAKVAPANEPDNKEPPADNRAVRGKPGQQARAQLPAAQASAMMQAMGVRPAISARPHVDELGRLVVSVETPSQVRARLGRAA